MVKCPICEKGELQKSKVKEEMHGVYLGEYPAEICKSCGESFVDSEAMRKIEEKAREKGVWGIGKKIKITKVGNSIAIRIPKIIADFMHLHEGEEAYIYPEKNKLIVEAHVS